MIEMQRLQRALQSTKNEDHNTTEAYQSWLENVSKMIETKTPREVAWKIHLLRQQQQFAMAQKSQLQQMQEQQQQQQAAERSRTQNQSTASNASLGEPKKRKRTDSSKLSGDSDRKRQKTDGHRQQLLELTEQSDNEDKSEQQENIMGSILEENQELIVSIRRNIQQGSVDANEPLMSDFKANIGAILKAMDKMKGIMAQMSPIDNIIGSSGVKEWTDLK